MLPIVWVLMSLFAGVAVYKAVVSYLDFRKASELAREQARNMNKQVTKAIVEHIRAGNFSQVDIGLYSGSEKVGRLEVEVNGSVSSDLSVNDILFN